MALTSQGTKKKVCYYYDGEYSRPDTGDYGCGQIIGMVGFVGAEAAVYCSPGAPGSAANATLASLSSYPHHR